jgi:hypothetical protein
MAKRKALYCYHCDRKLIKGKCQCGDAIRLRRKHREQRSKGVGE